MSELFHLDGRSPVPGPDPERRSYLTYASFSDPDGNGWLLQEIKERLPGREWEEFAVNAIDMQPVQQRPGFGSVVRSWTHFSVDRRSPGYCRVTFDHPPINTITATTVAELAELVGLIEQDRDLNVVVFDSANPDFYLAHYDVENDPGRTAALGVGPTGMPAWLDVLVRLSRAPVVSIASIRGRARGAGSEFVLACDLRFASRENTLLGQFEVGIGVLPGGGPMARLSRLVGRGRALEILLVADDLDGPRAEQYGYVNRADRRRPARRRGRGNRLDDSRASTTTRSRARSPMSTRSRCRPTASSAAPGRFSRAVRAPRAAGAVGPAPGARAQHRQRPRTVARTARGRVASGRVSSGREELGVGGGQRSRELAT